VGLEPDSFARLPSELSGGMRKRVGLARALALEPDIMLYDEPTTGLDPITTQMVNELIKKTSVDAQARSMTSIIISHDVQATLKISDYVAFLERGQIVEYGPKEEFIKSTNPTIRKFLDL
jgi:phospholipid/cholesterol/gamma-HCH transport system ATP-binding protein